MEQDGIPVIRVRGYKSPDLLTIKLLTCYLSNAVLTLRDRENLSASVILEGTGSGIQTCILIAELIGRKINNLAQVTEFFSQVDQLPQSGENQPRSDQRNKVAQVGIKIKLTYTPNEQDKQAPGYQVNELDEKKVNNWKSLYQFALLYSTDLAAAKIESKFSIKLQERNKRNTSNYRQRPQSQAQQGEHKHQQPIQHSSQSQRNDSYRSPEKRRGKRPVIPEHASRQNSGVLQTGEIKKRGNQRNTRGNEREDQPQKQQEDGPIEQGNVRTRGRPR